MNTHQPKITFSHNQLSTTLSQPFFPSFSSLKLHNLSHFPNPNVPTHFKQTDRVYQRFSHYLPQPQSHPNSDHQLPFFTSPRTPTKTSSIQQHQSLLKLKQKQKQAQNKIPSFIKQRQMSKSDQTEIQIKTNPETTRINEKVMGRSQTAIGRKKTQLLWLNQLQQENSLDMKDFRTKLNSDELKQEKEGKKQQNEVKKCQNRCKNKCKNKQTGLKQQSFKSTQSTIKSFNHLQQSWGNLFLPNLNQEQQEQVERDLMKLFQSQRQTPSKNEAQTNDELTREFLLILN